jgi:hypothetical protein
MDMHIVNGIAYTEEQTPAISVCGLRPMDDYRLRVRFNTGEAKIFDFKPPLKTPVKTKNIAETWKQFFMRDIIWNHNHMTLLNSNHSK